MNGEHEQTAAGKLQQLEALIEVLRKNRVSAFEGMGFVLELHPSALTVDTPATTSTTRPAHNPFFPKTEE